eukprot:308_1
MPINYDDHGKSQLKVFIKARNKKNPTAKIRLTGKVGELPSFATSAIVLSENKKKPSCVKTKKDECQTSEEEESETCSDDASTNTNHKREDNDDNVDDESDGKVDEWVQLNQKDTLDVLNLSPQDFKKWLKEGRMTLGPNCSAASSI